MKISNSALQQYTRQSNMMTETSLKSLEKMSSGNRINKGRDDAAGLLSSEIFRSGFGASSLKALSIGDSGIAQDGISKLQTAEVGLKNIQNILLEMKGSDDAGANSQKLSSLNEEIDEIIKNTTFGSKRLLDGSFEEAISVKTGANSSETLRISIKDMSSNAFESIEESIQAVTCTIADIAKWQQQLVDNLNSFMESEENLQAAENRIRDVDMAKQYLEITKYNILNSPSTAMLAQANQQPQGVLQLL